MYVLIGVVIGVIINHLIIKPFEVRYYRNKYRHN